MWGQTGRTPLFASDAPPDISHFNWGLARPINFEGARNVCRLVVASAARVTSTTRGMTGAAGTGRAVRATAIASAAAAVASASRRPRLCDGLPHVELRTRRTAAAITATSAARVARAWRRTIPVAAALAPARSLCATSTARR
jgi:hypothetical protein